MVRDKRVRELGRWGGRESERWRTGMKPVHSAMSDVRETERKREGGRARN